MCQSACSGRLCSQHPPGLANANPNCAQLSLGYPYSIDQSNGWHVLMKSATDAATCSGNCSDAPMEGQVTIDSMTPDNVKFIISWDNGSAGVYTGAIDDNGFVSGVTSDRWHPNSKADWHIAGVVPCSS
jgi:hypothetical protein